MSSPAAPAALSRGGWLWYGYCGILLVGAVVPAVPVLAGYLPNGVVAGAALLLIAAALLIVCQATQPAPPAGPAMAATAAVPGVLLLGISLLPPVVVLFVFPVMLVGVVWEGPLDGVGLLPPDFDYPFGEMLQLRPAAALLLLGAASAVTTHAMQRRRTSALEGLALGGPAAGLMALAALGAPWPVVPMAVLLTGLGLVVASGLTILGPWRRTVLTTQGGVYIASGLFGALPTRTTTVLGLALAALAAGVVGGWGRAQARVPGWVFMGLAGALTAMTAGMALGRPPREVAFAILGVALLMLPLAAALRAGRRREASAIEATAHVVALFALPFTANWVHAAQLLCAVWALAVALRSRWPGTSRSDRRFLLVYAGTWWLLAWWFLLADWGVNRVEPYTLPLAGLAALAGWACRRRWFRVRAHMAYGPAATLAVAPTLIAALAG
jgi:hypothetical protein